MSVGWRKGRQDEERAGIVRVRESMLARCYVWCGSTGLYPLYEKEVMVSDRMH